MFNRALFLFLYLNQPDRLSRAIAVIYAVTIPVYINVIVYL